MFQVPVHFSHLVEHDQSYPRINLHGTAVLKLDVFTNTVLEFIFSFMLIPPLICRLYYFAEILGGCCFLHLFIIVTELDDLDNAMKLLCEGITFQGYAMAILNLIG